MKKATVLVIEGQLVVGSRSWGHTQQAKLHWPVDVRVQGTRSYGPRDCSARLATTVRRRRRHSTEVGQVTWRCVVQTLPHQHRRLEDHSLTNWKPMKCLEDRRDVVMTTSAGDQTSCHILYRLEWRRRRWTSATPARSELQ